MYQIAEAVDFLPEGLFPTYLEIFTEEDGGNGDGSLIPVARVRSSGGNNIETETFGIYPARLTNIKVGKK